MNRFGLLSLLFCLFFQSLDIAQSQDDPAKFVELERIGKGDIADIEVSPNGKYLAAGGYALWIYDTASQELVSVIEQSGISAISWSTDSRQIAFGGAQDTIQVWDIETRQQISSYEGDIAPTLALDWSPDGNYVLFPGKSGNYSVDDIEDSPFQIYVWDPLKNALVYQLPATQGQVMSVAWSPDGSQFVASSEFGEVLRWNALTGEQLDSESPPINGRVFGLRWSPDSTQIAITSDDTETIVWDFEQVISSLNVDDEKMWDSDTVAWSPIGDKLAVGTYDGLVRIWNFELNRFDQTIEGHTDRVIDVDWLPDNSHFVTVSRDGSLKFWDSDSLTLTGIIEQHFSRIGSVVWSPNADKLAFTNSSDKVIRIWNLDSRIIEATLIGHQDRITDIAWSLDGKHIASGSNDKTVRIWNVDSYTLETTLHYEDKDTWPTDLAWSPTNLLAIASSQYVVVWDGLNEKSIGDFGEHSFAGQIAWSPDGAFFVVGGWPYVQIWNASTLEVTTTADTHLMRSSTRDLVWSSDGMLIAAATIDGYMIWDTHTGHLDLMQTDCEGGNGSYDVSWMIEDQQLLSVGCPDKLQLLDVANKTLLELPNIPVDSSTEISWMSDGSGFATNTGGFIRIWGLKP